VGVNTPGVGEYSVPEFTDDGPKYTLLQEPWFRIPPKPTKDCAHAYVTPLLYIWKGTQFSCDSRFKYEKDFWVKSQMSPGPGKYQHFTAFKKLKLLEKGLGANERFNNLTYFKEL
jgi:hypothetical protein